MQAPFNGAVSNDEVRQIERLLGPADGAFFLAAKPGRDGEPGPYRLGGDAKGASTYRFYALYDKVYRFDVLCHAYRCCFENQGAAGVDGQTFADIREYGPLKWLRELADELRKKTYRPQAATGRCAVQRRNAGYRFPGGVKVTFRVLRQLTNQ